MLQIINGKSHPLQLLLTVNSFVFSSRVTYQSSTSWKRGVYTHTRVTCSLSRGRELTLPERPDLPRPPSTLSPRLHPKGSGSITSQIKWQNQVVACVQSHHVLFTHQQQVSTFRHGLHDAPIDRSSTVSFRLLTKTSVIYSWTISLWCLQQTQVNT